MSEISKTLDDCRDKVRELKLALADAQAENVALRDNNQAVKASFDAVREHGYLNGYDAETEADQRHAYDVGFLDGLRAVASAAPSDARLTDSESGKAIGSALNLSSSSVPSGRSPR
jgi:hypothetical protein